MCTLEQQHQQTGVIQAHQSEHGAFCINLSASWVKNIKHTPVSLQSMTTLQNTLKEKAGQKELKSGFRKVTGKSIWKDEGEENRDCTTRRKG